MSIAEYARRLAGEPAGANRIRCPGPGHSRLDRSLSVSFASDGTFKVHSFAGDDFRDCRDYVKASLGLSDAAPVAFNDNAAEVDVESLRKRQDDAAGVWARSQPIAGTLAETYLTSRGLTYTGTALRYWPGGRALVALITDSLTAEPCGLHRTFLDRNGAKRDRKMLGRAKGGVVRLSNDSDAVMGLGIAEGIETALATGFRPVWACLSAGGMASLPVLPGSTSLTVFADNDVAGINAANEVGARWHSAGREVTLVVPAVGDFADIRSRRV